jgi:broad specificity phosphatase PhoE
MQLASRVALVRHGRSSHAHRGWVTARGFQAWREAYEAAGIRPGERVPPQLAELVREAELVVSSDAPRAVASARLLAPGREIVTSPLLRELDLESPRLGGVRLPLAAWALAVGGRTLVHSLPRRYPSAAEAARLLEAAAWLDQLARQRSLIVAVTHASFRRQLSARLGQRGWRAEPGRRSLRPWSAWILATPSGRSSP